MYGGILCLFVMSTTGIFGMYPDENAIAQQQQVMEEVCRRAQELNAPLLDGAETPHDIDLFTLYQQTCCRCLPLSLHYSVKKAYQAIYRQCHCYMQETLTEASPSPLHCLLGILLCIGYESNDNTYNSPDIYIAM